MTDGIKQKKGRLAYEQGRAAEAQVAQRYLDGGAVQLASRWRGQSGEIDLIFRDGPVVVFVEVKSSKHNDWAAHALSPRQQQRIMATAEEFCAGLQTGSLSEMRFDVALHGPQGRIDILEAALGV